MSRLLSKFIRYQDFNAENICNLCLKVQLLHIFMSVIYRNRLISPPFHLQCLALGINKGSFHLLLLPKPHHQHNNCTSRFFNALYNDSEIENVVKLFCKPCPVLNQRCLIQKQTGKKNVLKKKNPGLTLKKLQQQQKQNKTLTRTASTEKPVVCAECRLSKDVTVYKTIVYL